MGEQALLRARLSKAQALLERPGHEGERIAAQAAVERIGARLAQLRHANPRAELLFPLSDVWGDDVFALLENHRAAGDGLYRTNLAWAFGATSFMRAAALSASEAIARFWFGDHPAG